MPVNEVESLYSRFLKEVNDKNCTLSSQIQSPFTSTSAATDAFESSLYICQKVEFERFNQEVPLLCNEIFGFLKTIICLPKDVALPEIKIGLSSDVCKDFALKKAVLSEGLMKHLSDNFNCNLMCKDDFRSPCQVLLWSFLVQLQIKSSIENSKKLDETPLIEIKQEQNQNPSMEVPKESKEVEIQQVDQNANTIPVKTTDEKTEDKKAGPDLEQKEPLKTEENIQDIASDHQETHELKDNTQIKESTDIANMNNVLAEKEKPAEPPKIDAQDNKVVKSDPKDNNPQSEDVHGNTDNVEEVPDTGIQHGETEPASDAGNTQLGKVATDLSSPSVDTKDDKITITSSNAGKTIPEKGGSEKVDELAENEHANTGEDGAQTTHDAQIQTIPGFKADYLANVAQVDKNVSTKKDEASSATIAEVQKVITEASTSVKNPVSEAMSSVVSDNPSSTPMSSEVVTAPLEKMEDDIPGDKDLDQYNGTIYEPPQNKESNSESPGVVIVPKEPIIDQKEESKGFAGFTSRDSFGRGSDEIQVIAAFPEQEDSHFFFYFLSIVLILMAGYLIFHNKQKIIALIVEGRHERRRRSHGLGYKKLETK